MDPKEGLTTNKPPLFIGENYACWSVRMKFRLMSLGYKFRRSVEKEYQIPDDLPIDKDELDQYEAKAKALNAILNGLTNSMFVKLCNAR